MMLLGQAPTLLKSYASELRALLAMLRLRLFEVLALLPPVSLESNFAALLRLLVSYFFDIQWWKKLCTFLVSKHYESKGNCTQKNIP